MPKNPLQKLVFGALMALAMVYGMEVYNAALRSGLSGACFRVPWGELAGLCAVVMALEALVAGPVARKWATARLGQGAAPVATVCCMCPLMSLVAVVLFKGAVLAAWFRTFALNFPMALAWQLLVAGPAVRLAFAWLFPGRSPEARP